MDQSSETETVKVDDKKPKNKKHIGRVILLIILVLLLTGVAGGAGYWWRDKSAKTAGKKQSDQIATLQQDKSNLEKQLAAEKAKSTTVTIAPTPTPCTAKAPGSSTIDNIEASITSGNTAALAGYMAPSVSVVFAAADALPAKTPAQAVTDITGFITPDNSSWDYNFSLPAATIASYRAGSYKQYIPATAVVGKATNNRVIAFSFDCNTKINMVFMAADDALLK